MGIPYFKFFTTDYLSGRIQHFDMTTQGIFLNICALLWKNKGELYYNIDELSHILRVDKQLLSKCLNLLIEKDIIKKFASGLLEVCFISEQLQERKILSVKRSVAGRKGGKQLQSKCKAIASLSESESESESKEEKINKKEKYLETVFLSQEEYNSLCKGWGVDKKSYSEKERNLAIEYLDNYLRTNGKKYKSHYAVLQGWVYDKIKESSGKNPLAVETWEEKQSRITAESGVY